MLNSLASLWISVLPWLSIRYAKPSSPRLTFKTVFTTVSSWMSEPITPIILPSFFIGADTEITSFFVLKSIYGSLTPAPYNSTAFLNQGLALES